MTIQVVIPNSFENRYPCRGDRVNEEPTAKNAQGLFPPDACIFVGNLSTKVSAEDLAEDLKNSLSSFGPCHVKIKQDKKKGLPGAFVQFEQVNDALWALSWDECTVLHERWLRIEKAKGRRTACLGLRSGASISQSDVSIALGGRGPVEVYCLEHYPTGPFTWTMICKVTFAYVDDCRDAIKLFQKDDTYYMVLLDIDGNPFFPPAQKTVAVPKQRKKQIRGALAASNVKDKPKNPNPQPHRNGPNNHRAGHRLAPRQDPPPFYNGNPYAPEPYPVPPFMFNDMPMYGNANPPPPYFPAPFHPGNGYPTPPMIPARQPGYNSPMPAPPPAASTGPFIAGSQPAPIMNNQAYYPEPYYLNMNYPDMNYPDIGYYGAPARMAGVPYMYCPPPFYGEPYPPPPPPTTMYNVPYPQETQRNGLPSAVKVNDEAEEQTVEPAEPEAEQSPELTQATGEGVAVAAEEEENAEVEQPEKAPKLIRINGSDSDEEEKEREPEKAPRLIRIRDDLDEEEEEEGEREPEKASRLIHVRDDSDSDSDVDDNCNKKRITMPEPVKEREAEEQEKKQQQQQQQRSKLPSPREPLEGKYQPSTGITIEEYVRREAVRLGSELGEEALVNVIEDMEMEQRQTCF